MKIRFLCLALFAIVVNVNYAQTTVYAGVMVVVNQGTYSYAILSETGTSNLYQTSAYYPTQGYLTTNQQIEIAFDDITDKTQGTIVASTITNVYCFLEGDDPIETAPQTITLPYVSNGILFFEDQDHISEIHDWMEYIIDTSAIEMNEALDLLEDQFTGFSSFRTKLDLQFGITQNGFTNQEMDDYLAIDFVRDEILKTFLNANRMIGINDSVFFMVEENLILGMGAEDLDLISGIASLPDSLDIIGPGGIFAALGDPTGFQIYSPVLNRPIHNYATIYVDDDISYKTFPSVIKNGCEVYKRSLQVELWEQVTSGGVAVSNYYDPTFYDLAATRTLTIDWGDGTEPQVIENYHNDHEPIVHFYSELGTYYPITKYEFTDRYGDLQIAIDTLNDSPIDIDIACTDEEANEVDYTVSGNYRMVSELFVLHNVVFKQIGAKTTFYQYKSGAWVKEKADLYAKVSGVFREIHTCAYKEDKTETKSRLLRKDLQADKTKLWKAYQIGNGDIKSRHYSVKGALFLVVELVLNPC